MNASEHCEGVFTRIHKYKQTIEKSVLDYVLSHQTWKSTLLLCKLMRKSTLHHAWRSLKHGKRYSDHCAIKFCRNVKAFEQKQASEKIKVRNFNDPEEKFSELTEPSAILSDM